MRDDPEAVRRIARAVRRPVLVVHGRGEAQLAKPVADAVPATERTLHASHLGAHGSDTEHFRVTRDFLLRRDRMLRELFSGAAETSIDGRAGHPVLPGPLGPHGAALARRNTPKEALRWGYVTNMGLDSFRTLREVRQAVVTYRDIRTFQ